MYQKEIKLIITFSTTTDAMAMEYACNANHMEGRLIPVPEIITAGCGLAWCALPEQKQVILDFIENRNLNYEKFIDCLI